MAFEMYIGNYKSKSNYGCSKSVFSRVDMGAGWHAQTFKAFEESSSVDIVWHL